jgi:hypothetical protein
VTKLFTKNFDKKNKKGLNSPHEKTAASSDGFCGSVVVFNRGVEFASLSGQL